MTEGFPRIQDFQCQNTSSSRQTEMVDQSIKIVSLHECEREYFLRIRVIRKKLKLPPPFSPLSSLIFQDIHNERMDLFQSLNMFARYKREGFYLRQGV